VTSFDVVIIGTGFGGIGMAAEIERRGLGTYVLLEQADDLGGTWRDNTYPGSACDVPADLYSFSWASKSWSRRFPPHDEILAYLRDVADERGVTPNIRFGATVTSVRFDDASGRWEVETAEGLRITAACVVSAMGQLNRPHRPDIDGLDEFAGPVVHSARWDDALDVAGRRVGVVGTGASAIQIVPAIAGATDSLTVFQRSAPYVLAKPDRVTPAVQHRIAARAPWVTRTERARFFARGELLGLAIAGNERVASRVVRDWRTRMESVILDPELRAICTPDYRLGCKRILFSEDWYPALARDNVTVVTEPITRVTKTGVRTGDGALHRLDVIVLATGFEATRFLQPVAVTGRGGVDLQTSWGHRPIAYRGVAYPGFPNFFILYGPNTNLGSNSIVYMLEAQIGYVASILQSVERSRLAFVDVRPEALDRWRAMVDEATERSAWVTGCHNWYTVDGVNTNNWPKATYQYARLMRQVDLIDYEATPLQEVSRPVA
jgi:cation diffusion facilitator CzcD-associated flavoprotein CzcO